MSVEANIKIIFRDKFHLLGLLYDKVFLDSRRQAGMPLSPADKSHLMCLSSNFEGDTPPGRRRHRRISIMLPAEIKSKTAVGHAIVQDISAGGMLLICRVPVRLNESLMIKISRPGGVHYSFPIRVVRCRAQGSAYQLAVQFSGIPLELCFGNRESRESQPLPSPLIEPLRKIA